MSATFHQPKYRLRRQLRTAGGMAVVKALRDADANLESLKDAARLEVVARLAHVDASFKNAGGPVDRAAIAVLYDATNSIVGLASVAGWPMLDQAALSLCSVLDGILQAGQGQAEVVSVHVNAMHLLTKIEGLDDVGAQHVVNGLLQLKQLDRARPGEIELPH
jgi:hypothetical protein